jgi:hypothetical protein
VNMALRRHSTRVPIGHDGDQPDPWPSGHGCRPEQPQVPTGLGCHRVFRRIDDGHPFRSGGTSVGIECHLAVATTRVIPTGCSLVPEGDYKVFGGA